MNPDVRFYVSLVLRRLPLVLAIISATTSLGLLYAFALPPIFRAEARLLFESPQIPDALAASTVGSTVNENLMAIQQRVLTRDNLLLVADQHGVFAEEPELSLEERVRAMTERTAIVVPTVQGNTGVVVVAFLAGDPAQSAEVTNDIAEQLLAWNTELRTSASGSTREFFDQEVRRLTTELAEQNARILSFEQANRDSLPESLTYRRTRQTSQQERLLQVDRELAGLRDRRQRLEELYDRTGRLVTPLESRSPEELELSQLRQELASAVVVLSPSNPRVKVLELQIAALEEVVAQQLGDQGEGSLSAFDVQMLDIDGQIEYLAEQKALIEKDLTLLDQSIEATPGNSIMLAELQSDYETLRVQYEQAVASLSDARIGDRIEVTDRGQRISFIERALPPAVRAEPNRKLIVAAGFAAGFLLSCGLLMLLEFSNQTIRRPKELTRALGAAPFGTVAYIDGPGGSRAQGSLLLGIATVFLVSLPLLLLTYHLYVAPLGTLFGQSLELSPANRTVETSNPAVSE